MAHDWYDFLHPARVPSIPNHEFVETLRGQGFHSPKVAVAFSASFQASWLGSALDRIEELEEEVKKLRAQTNDN